VLLRTRSSDRGHSSFQVYSELMNKADTNADEVK
jgi:hypothetical protein